MSPTAQTILVTGGTGYIGSHTVVQLLEAGNQVVILDNLCNSKREVVNRIEQITECEAEPSLVRALGLEAKQGIDHMCRWIVLAVDESAGFCSS